MQRVVFTLPCSWYCQCSPCAGTQGPLAAAVVAPHGASAAMTNRMQPSRRMRAIVERTRPVRHEPASFTDEAALHFPVRPRGAPAVTTSEAPVPRETPPELRVPRPDESAPADEMTMARAWLVHLRES